VLLTSPSTGQTEHATLPSPRSPWSSPNESQRAKWHAFHAVLAAEATAYAPAPRTQLLLVGDSIFERLRSSSYGVHRQKYAENGQVMAHILARWPNPIVLACSGDQTQHAIWRLSHGEFTPQMRSDSRLLVALHIGTNNLAAGHLPEEAAAGITALARRLLSTSHCKLLVVGLLPRGDGHQLLPSLCPPRCTKDGRPFRSFLPAVNRVNSHVLLAIQNLLSRYPSRVAFRDCGAPFRAAAGSPGSTEVNLSLMPDALHPNAAGYHALTSCVRAGLEELEASHTE